MPRYSKDEILRHVLSIKDEKKQCEMFSVLIELGAIAASAFFSNSFSSSTRDDIAKILEKNIIR